MSAEAYGAIPPSDLRLLPLPRPALPFPAVQRDFNISMSYEFFPMITTRYHGEE